MSTAVETAFPPLPDGKGNYIGSVLPIYGCATHCELWPDICWLCGKSGAGLRAKLGRHCPDCLSMKPHVHWKKINGIHRLRKAHYFSGHMGDIADLSKTDIRTLIGWMECNRQHIFAPFTHRPMEFYAKYSKWSKNVWACGTFTSGEIAFPPELECGVRVAYVEPVMGQLYLQQYDPGYCDVGWLVIGLLNHASYTKLGISLEMLASWIKPLMADARALGIPTYMKSHRLWERLGIALVQQWPQSPTPPEEK